MIRNFLYLDSQKLRSISSQIFEGFSEQVVRSSHESESEQEHQKGPVASGRFLADIFTTEKSSTELKFLEDHAYTLFETHLIDSGLVDSINKEDIDAESLKSFVKIRARLKLNDVTATSNLLRNFNEIGEAFWRITNQNAVLSNLGKRMSDADVRKKATESGMQLDKSFLSSASMVFDFGFKGLIEASMTISDKLFSAPLKREFLRESEDIILHKYSRYTHQEFTMLGIVTQNGMQSSEKNLSDVSEADGVKEAMRSLSLHMRTFEQLFSGPSKNEIVIDPIALYTIL